MFDCLGGRCWSIVLCDVRLFFFGYDLTSVERFVYPLLCREIARHYRKARTMTFEEMEKEDRERITVLLATLRDFIWGGDSVDRFATKLDAVAALRDIEELISSRILNDIA